jgi:hypothetical protein
MIRTVYATYDQGSTQNPEKIQIPRSFTFILYSTANFFYLVGYRPTSSSDLYLSIVYFYLAQSIVIIYLFYYFFIRKRKQRRRELLEAITQEMMRVRRSIRNNPLSLEPFHDSWSENTIPSAETDKQYGKRLKLIRHKRKIIKEINDYLRIDDFYWKLAERNSYIGKRRIQLHS